MDFDEIQDIIDELEDTRDTLLENNPVEWIIDDLNKVISKLKDYQY